MSDIDPGNLKVIEGRLARNIPFGDWQYIDNATQARYARRLEMLVRHLPAVLPLLEIVQGASPESRYHVIGDPVTRAAINSALGGLELKAADLPLDKLMRVFEDSRRHLTSDSRSAPLQEGAHQKLRIGPALHHGWIWCDEREEDVWGQSFRELFASEPSRSALRTPDEVTHDVLVRCTTLLEYVLPQVARSALHHAHLIAVTDVLDRQEWGNPKRLFPYESFSTFTIPGALFLAQGVLRNPYKAAEHLLHEALHLKWYDLQHTHAVFRRGYHARQSPLIRSLWNRSRPSDSNEWPVCRTQAAMHVYVHLALYFSQLERRADELQSVFGSFEGYNPSVLKGKAFERARYLGLSLRQTGWQELGLAGQKMVDWLMDMLDQMGAGPAPDDANVHLLLDLYEREMSEFGQMVESLSSGPRAGDGAQQRAARQCVSALLRGELEVAERIASTVGEPAWRGGSAPDVARTAEWLQGASDEELVKAFRATRGSVASMLRGVRPELFSQTRFPGTQQPLGELVREMVETSSAQLNLLYDPRALMGSPSARS